MYWIIFAAACSLAGAAKLDNSYLPPPPGAQQAGGGEGLQPPLEPPYLDQYSDPAPGSPASAPTHRGRQYGRGINNLQIDPSARRFLDNEEEIRRVKDSSFEKGKGRFLSGSYSYTGPDNVLVTVTYKADDRQGRKLRGGEQYEGEEEGEAQPQGYQRSQDEDGVVPTPATLPSELKKAFDFHNKNQNPQDEDHKGYKYGQPGKNKPEVHQGYSYPKQGQ